MRTIKASDFKARCLALIDDIERTGEPILITNHDKPVAELHPYRLARAKSPPLGLQSGQLIIHGDLINPIEGEWEAKAS